ncbi:MAG TPA: hypothetical protein DET40_01900 [Lentisphaeria bacterium]|nr:MAG: hypothetical protein A2X45_21055 [Lentisphaerae bacterium GWF2_50_93]HCE42285.1 hypothetical protein [Lentisphaeria bacterium]
MKKLIYLILGLLFIPVILVIIFVAIPLFLLFLMFLRIFTRRRRKPAPGRPPPPSRNVSRQDDVYDIECEVVDEEDPKK